MRQMNTWVLVISCLAMVRPSAAQFELVEAFPGLPSFAQSVGLQSADDGTPRLYVTGLNGLILSFNPEGGEAVIDTLLDLRRQISVGNEAGLIGLAFHPNFAQNGHFYVHYVSTPPLHSVIARYTVSAVEPTRADPASRLVLFDEAQPGPEHYGGQLAFGPDGYLYVGLGDGECCMDPNDYGQDLTVPFASILRLDVDRPAGFLNYGIPPDNPFVGNTEGFREEVYAYGLRNPWRFSFDAETGALWVGDVGEDAFEEINLIEAGGNYGWSMMEGTTCFAAYFPCEKPTIAPVWMYEHGGGAAVTGGYVYRGAALPSLVGKYIYGDFVQGQVWALTPGASTGEAPVNELLVASDLNISSFGEDAAGELYVVSFSNGRFYRLRDATASGVEQEQPGRHARLALNGPNPFDARTSLRFETARAGRVRLAVYDLLGREVAVLFDAVVPPMTTHEVTFDASALPAGLYLGRLEAGGAFFTKTLIRLR